MSQIIYTIPSTFCSREQTVIINSNTSGEKEAAQISLKYNITVNVIYSKKRQSDIVLCARDLLSENIIDNAIILNITTQPDVDIKKDICRFFFNHEMRKCKSIFTIDVHKKNKGRRSNIFDSFIYLNDKNFTDKLKKEIQKYLSNNPDIIICRIQKNIPEHYYNFLKELLIPCIICQ